jgi:hypothetical protein
VYLAATGENVTSNFQPLSEILRRMPVPPPRDGFVDQALAQATARSSRHDSNSRSKTAFARWETWMGAAVGAAVAATATMIVMRPSTPSTPAPSITLAMNETRNVDVLIDSERLLEDATIKVATTGAVELDGLDDAREVQWQARLERGRNVLSLPVIARTAGTADLIAVIEHGGRTQRVAIRMLVKQPPRRGVA